MEHIGTNIIVEIKYILSKEKNVVLPLKCWKPILNQSADFNNGTSGDTLLSIKSGERFRIFSADAKWAEKKYVGKRNRRR